MHITEHTSGEVFTIAIEGTAMGNTVRAQLSGRVRRSVIDGLLWWLLDRKLDAFVAECIHQPLHATIERAKALYHGDQLMRYIHTAQWDEASDQRAKTILDTLQKYLPELAPLREVSTAHAAEHAAMLELANIMHERIGRTATHGIEHAYTQIAA